MLIPRNAYFFNILVSKVRLFSTKISFTRVEQVLREKLLWFYNDWEVSWFQQRHIVSSFKMFVVWNNFVASKPKIILFQCCKVFVKHKSLSWTRYQWYHSFISVQIYCRDSRGGEIKHFFCIFSKTLTNNCWWLKIVKILKWTKLTESPPPPESICRWVE